MTTDAEFREARPLPWCLCRFCCRHRNEIADPDAPELHSITQEFIGIKPKANKQIIDFNVTPIEARD